MDIRTIHLDRGGMHEEAKLTGAAKPGTCVKLNPDGTVSPGYDGASIRVLKEDSMIGMTVRSAYPDGGYASYVLPPKNERVGVRVGESQMVALGSPLVIDPASGLAVAPEPDEPHQIVAESTTTTAAGETALIVGRVC